MNTSHKCQSISLFSQIVTLNIMLRWNTIRNFTWKHVYTWTNCEHFRLRYLSDVIAWRQAYPRDSPFENVTAPSTTDYTFCKRNLWFVPQRGRKRDLNVVHGTSLRGYCSSCVWILYLSPTLVSPVTNTPLMCVTWLGIVGGRVM